MTDTTLPPEVAEAIKYVDGIFDDADNGEWSTVRTHLHRLAEENARTQEKCDLLEQANAFNTLSASAAYTAMRRAEAERDALKARIAEAPVQVRPIPPTPEGLVGARFAMVRLEDGE